MKSESTICQKTKTQLQIERNYCERNKNELFYEKISSENELESCKLESEKIIVTKHQSQHPLSVSHTYKIHRLENLDRQ